MAIDSFTQSLEVPNVKRFNTIPNDISKNSKIKNITTNSSTEKADYSDQCLDDYSRQQVDAVGTQGAIGKGTKINKIRILDLPEDVLIDGIMTYLNREDLNRLSLTSKTLYSVAQKNAQQRVFALNYSLNHLISKSGIKGYHCHIGLL